MRICQGCKTANEPLAVACANCNAPLSESDHHIVVEPAFIDDIPSLEEVSRYQGANVAADPEPQVAASEPTIAAPPLENGATSKPALGSKLSFVVSALSSIAPRDPATGAPSSTSEAATAAIESRDVPPVVIAPPPTEHADVARSSTDAGASHDEPQTSDKPIEQVPVDIAPSVVDAAASEEAAIIAPSAEAPPVDVLQRPSAARFRPAAPIDERPAENAVPFSGDDALPVTSPELVASNAEVPRAPVSAIRPYARKVAPARRPVSRRNIVIAAVFGTACIALLAIVALINATHKGGTGAVALATASPAAAASDEPDLTTTLGASPASTASPSPAIAATAASTPKPKMQRKPPTIAKKTRAAGTPHPKPAVAPKPAPTPNPIPTPRPTPPSKPTATAKPEAPAAKPPPKPIAVGYTRQPIRKRPALLASPRVATAPTATASQASANQPLVIRSSLGRGSAVSLATGGASGLPDLQWHELSADQWQLLTVNGASAHRLGVIGYPAFFAITANDLAHYSYEPAALSSISGNDLNGTVLAVRTNGGAYAKVYIQESNYATTVYYNLYAAGSSK